MATKPRRTAAHTSPVPIAPELIHLAVPVDTIHPHPDNPRRGNLDRITESLTAHGQYAPILVQKSTGHVIKGNHTLQAMRRLGATHVAAQHLDIDDDRARRILAIDNRSSDDAGYDQQALAELLTELETLDGTGWDPDDLDDVLLQLQTDTPPPHDPATATPADTPGPAPTPGTSLGLPVHPTPPATDARYAETPEQEATRVAAAAASAPIAAAGLAQMVVVLTVADRDEAYRLVQAARAWLGADLKTGEVMLRALRTLAAIGDHRHTPGHPIHLAALLKAAGHDPLTEALP